jgi:hypothetical protein
MSPQTNWTEDVGELLAETGNASSDEIDIKVQQAQNALIDLKRQQDEIERQKRELEDLSRKQREFEEGRREVLEKLTRGLVVLERQEFEIRREAEQIQEIREGFNEQIEQIESIKPQEWPPRELQSELTRALAIIDQALALYTQARARIEILREETAADELEESYREEGETPSGKTFASSLKQGFAFTLPLMVFLLILTLIYMARH